MERSAEDLSGPENIGKTKLSSSLRYVAILAFLRFFLAFLSLFNICVSEMFHFLAHVLNLRIQLLQVHWNIHKSCQHLNYGSRCLQIRVSTCCRPEEAGA